MSAEHKFLAVDCNALSLRLNASHPPSAQLVPSSDKIKLSLTVYGDDPDEPLTPQQLMKSSFLWLVSGWLLKQEECLGLFVDGDEDEPVEWQVEEDEEGNARLVTFLSPDAAQQNSPAASARAPTQQLTNLNITITFNRRLITDDLINSSLELTPPEKLPKEVRKPLRWLLNRLSEKLAAAYPSCFNPAWNARLERDAKLYDALSDSLERVILGSSNPATRIKLDNIKTRLSKQFGPDVDSSQSQHSSANANTNAGPTPLRALLKPALSALARQLVHPPDKLVVVAKEKSKKHKSDSPQPASDEVAQSKAGDEGESEKDDRDGDDEIEAGVEIEADEGRADEDDEGEDAITIIVSDDAHNEESEAGEFLDEIDFEEEGEWEEEATDADEGGGELDSIEEVDEEQIAADEASEGGDVISEEEDAIEAISDGEDEPVEIERCTEEGDGERLESVDDEFEANFIEIEAVSSPPPSIAAPDWQSEPETLGATLGMMGSIPDMEDEMEH